MSLLRYRWGILGVVFGLMFFGWSPHPTDSQSTAESSTTNQPTDWLAVQLPAANRGENMYRPVAPPSLRLRGERLSAADVAKQAHRLSAFTPEGLVIAPNQIGANRAVSPDWLATAQRLGVLRSKQTAAELTGYAAVLVSPRAAALRLHFTEVNLPPGAEVYVYGVADDWVSGPYRERGPFGSGEFWTDVLAGDTVVVEWLTPAGGAPAFRIGEVSHIWDSPLPPTVSATGKVAAGWPEAGACNLDAMCGPEPEKDGVARIAFQTSQGTSVCTGTVLTTRNGDFAPFFLTANHCVSAPSEAQSVQAFWFYRTTACNSGVVSSGFFRSPTGATLLQTNAPSDHTLLEILGVIPRNLFHAGWDTNPRPNGTNVFALHHPDGGTPISSPQLSFLRRSLGVIAGQNTNCGGGTGLQGGYQINWNQGVTEPGSSGSGIWYTTSQGSFLIGVLSCGPAACGVPPSQLFDNYGKFSAFAPSINNFLDGGSDDSFEPNDTRATANFVTLPVNANNLVVKQVAEDWYAVQATTGARITATVAFTHNFGDIDLELYRNQEAQPVAISASTNNSETIDFTNTGPNNVFFLRVFLFNDTRNTYQMTLNVTGGAPPPPATTVGMFRPSNGFFYLRFSNTPGFADTDFFYGLPADVPVIGDWNGDGVDTVGIFRNGQFFLRNSNTAGFADLPIIVISGTLPSDIPLAGDWNGDGIATVGVFRQGRFFLRNSNTSGPPDIVFDYGGSDDLPIVGDWNGDRIDTIGVYRNGTFFLRNSNGPGLPDITATFGAAGDTPLAGDWDGNGADSIGVFRISGTSAQFFLSNANVSGPLPPPINYGLTTDRPVVGKWR
ncbi:hypothetical protein J8C06_12335 [Chloracidobacterium validum]|uniref:Uncharacterized protein n=1 Tax=Chloracidobacterium validum TaxID=2821543 RepID=A0ABX8BGD3_9BACT|nr:hypothetical protein [Chloracidobacterium validum]QUW04565.1 hypothetical protein J8C06_12335 [Chloracidobacterium validum]